MKRMLLALSIAGALAPSLCKAQVMIDMTRITCADYLAMPLDETLNYAAWMSGYYSQKTGKTTVDFDAFATNVNNVKSWCASNPKETVMAGVQRAVDKAK